ncbi:hypothetical protein IM40_06115 [Candidatus Paracaedimonas acanthamoebae]|nr:hypothetical protein IM40_06115 [Candidatus Paracaedimonas acanthamoebae]
MVSYRSFVFSFYSLFILMHSASLIASSEFEEASPKGYRAPHSSMISSQVDPHAPQELNRVALMKKIAPLEDRQFVLDELEKAEEALENITITAPTTTSSKKKGHSPRLAKLKVLKEKEKEKEPVPVKGAKAKKVQKPKATAKSKNEAETISQVIANNNILEDESRPVTMIIKPYDEEKPTELDNKSEEKKPLKVNNLSSNVAQNLFDEFLGEKKETKKTFALPARLEAWELILLLLAGDDPHTGMTYKVFFPGQDLSCNYKSLLKGKKEEDLFPFLLLDKFRNSEPLAILKKYLVIKDNNEVVKTSFSRVESLTINNAIEGLQKKIEDLCLRHAGARLSADERRSHSTLAGHISKLAEYQIVEKQYDMEGVVLSLTFYHKK